MKTTFLFTLIAMLFLATRVEAQTCVKYSDIAKLGGKIITAGTTSTTTAIKAFPSATVDVYNIGTLVHTSLFSDSACSVVKGNPTTADATTGAFSFYLAPARIDIRISPAGGSPSPFTNPDVLIPTYTAQSIKETSGPTMLTVGTVGDKQYLRRSGAALIGAAIFNWFNVLDYGAVGNGTTDDTTAINLAIAAFNSAGKGRLYFPGGLYKVASTLTTISALGIIQGDGDSTPTVGSQGASIINFTSGSTNLLNISSVKLLIRGLALHNTAGSAPTAGYAIFVTGSNIYQRVDVEDFTVYRFYNGIRQDGGLWHVAHGLISTSTNIGLETLNSFNDDAGDWVIDDVKFTTATAGTPAKAISLKNGGRIANCKILAPATGIVLESGVNTSNMQISNTSIELFTVEGIHIYGGTPAFSWANVQLNQVELLPDPANTTNIGIAGSATQNLQLNNIKCVATVTPSTACIAAGGTSSNWSVGTIDLNGWPRDIQSGGSYVGAPLPASAVSAIAIASNRINPEYQFFHLTCGGGANTTKNIFLNGASMSPYDNRNYTIRFIADEACPWDNTGNIATAAGTMTVNRLIVAQYIRGDKWYFSQ